MLTAAEISAWFDGVNAAWKTNDGQEFAATFADDGSLINPFGERADGRATVAAMYNQYFAGMLAGTTASAKVLDLRAVGDDHAFVDAEQTINAADGSVMLVVHLACLLRREGGTWKFLDSRPYIIATPG